MSIPFYSFYTLPLKLSNKGMDFTFPPLKLSNKEIKEYIKLFFSFLSILFHSLIPNEGLRFDLVEILENGEDRKWKNDGKVG